MGLRADERRTARGLLIQKDLKKVLQDAASVKNEAIVQHHLKTLISNEIDSRVEDEGPIESSKGGKGRVDIRCPSVCNRSKKRSGLVIEIKYIDKPNKKRPALDNAVTQVKNYLSSPGTTAFILLVVVRGWEECKFKSECDAKKEIEETLRNGRWLASRCLAENECLSCPGEFCKSFALFI